MKNIIKKIKKAYKRVYWKLFREKAFYKDYAANASISLGIYHELCEENGLLNEYWKRRSNPEEFLERAKVESY